MDWGCNTHSLESPCIAIHLYSFVILGVKNNPSDHGRDRDLRDRDRHDHPRRQ